MHTGAMIRVAGNHLSGGYDPNQIARLKRTLGHSAAEIIRILNGELASEMIK